MQLQESGEMYLETIYLLSKRQDNVRSVDIGEYMGYSRPSVSRAIGILKQAGYVSVEGNGNLLLTETGLSTAAAIYDRHHSLTRLFVSLGVSETTAAEDACKIEHIISDESFLAVKKYLAANDLDDEPFKA